METKTQYRGFKVGQRVRCLHSEEYYGNAYWYSLLKSGKIDAEEYYGEAFSKPGDMGTIAAFPPKVLSTPGGNYFACIDMDSGQRVGAHVQDIATV